MTGQQWAVFTGIMIVAIAVGVSATLTWTKAVGPVRRTSAVLGVAFAVVAVICTFQLVAIAANQRAVNARNEKLFQDRIDCTRQIVQVLEARDAALIASSGSDVRIELSRLLAKMPLPQC